MKKKGNGRKKGKRKKRLERERMTRTKARRIHCKKRAILRYNLEEKEFNRHVLRAITLKVGRGEGEFLHFSSWNRRYSECLVSYGQEFRVIFDQRKKELATFLPRYQLEENQLLSA